MLRIFFSTWWVYQTSTNNGEEFEEKINKQKTKQSKQKKPTTVRTDQSQIWRFKCDILPWNGPPVETCVCLQFLISDPLR